MSADPIRDLKSFAKRLRTLPRTLAIKVAAQGAPAITALARSTFRVGANAYGDTWAPGYDGDRVTMRKTGALASKVFYTAVGTRIRAVLGVPYARYQIGKRNVFPRGGGALPTSYVQALERIVNDLSAKELGQ